MLEATAKSYMEQPLRAYRGDEPFVFVCYSHEDKAIVYPELQWLQEHGLHVWYDEGISAGQIWRAEIAESIGGASKFLYYISAASLGSAHCNREVEYALNREVEIVPVYLSETKLSPQLDLSLAPVHALHRAKDAAYQTHLLEALGRASGASRTTPKVKRQRRSAIAISLLLTVLLVGGVTWLAPESWRNLFRGSVVPERSIVVLPFANVGNDPANDYLVDGFSEELMTALGRVPGLQLAARTSSVYFKTHPADLATIGAALNVRYALEGSVRRNGDSLRITASLVDIAGGFELASLVLDRTMGDLLKLQSDIAVAIVDAFAIELTASQLRSATDAGTTSEQAFDLSLKARDLMNGDNAADFVKAQELLTAAIALDPHFYAAYTMLTGAVHVGAFRSTEYESGYERMKALRRQVEALDPDGTRPTVAYDRLLWSRVERDRQTEEAVAHAALARDPKDVFWLEAYAHLLSNAGLVAAALDYYNRARQLDPFNAAVTEGAGGMLSALGRYDEARVAFERCLKLQPARFGCFHEEVNTLTQMGRIDDARTLFGDSPVPHFWTCHWGDLAACKPYDVPDPAFNALLAARAGDFDLFFKLQNDAVDLQLNVPVSQRWQHIAWWPAELLADPRYQQLLERLNLTDQWQADLCQRARSLTPATGIAVTCV